MNNDEIKPMDKETVNEQGLRRMDYLWITLVCVAVWGVSIVDGRGLTTHESTHSQNVVEMWSSGEYLIPTYGGRPWLERPPVPHWLSGVVAGTVASPSQSWALRLGSVLMAWVTVLILGWSVGHVFGRAVGFLSAVLLITTREFAAYATGPEADIFLACFVTIAGALFIRAEFSPNGTKPERPTFFGNRSWQTWGFFLVLGVTNAMKGPLFGTAFLATSMAVYFFYGRAWQGLRRYIWFWGWLSYLLIGLMWPVFAYLHYPDVADIWAYDYGHRWNKNYIGEPFWYYLVHVPWNLFPWVFLALLGLLTTRHQALKRRPSSWLFIWCWAIVPPVVFSSFNGKHHHYMLSCMAPHAVLAAAGAVAFWNYRERLPRWLRSPIFGIVVVGVPIAVLVLLFGKKLGGPDWLPYTVAIGSVVCLGVSWYCLGVGQARVAIIGTLVVAAIVHTAAYRHRTEYLNSYKDDFVFLQQTLAQVPEGTIYVLNDYHPLNGAWLLYYLGPRSRFLHNETFLVSDRITAPEIYIVGRQKDFATLQNFGIPKPLVVSSKTRAEASPVDRYTLFHLTFHPDLVRQPEPRVNGMQATGRAEGPKLQVERR